jgi:predicted enzyme related to lactoylglutathione lyase
MRHAFVHFDLNTSDFAGVRRFYEALFDWDFVDVDLGSTAPQAQILPASGPSGGLQPTASRGARSQWVPYVAVDDVRAMLRRVREAGGAVIQDYTPVPGLGAQAIVQDPGGTQLGLWEMEVAVAAAPAPKVVEVIEAEVIEDAEVVEEASGPEVVMEGPVEIEVVAQVAGGKPGRKKRASKRAAEPAPVEPAPVQAAPVEAVAPEAPAPKRKAAKKKDKKEEAPPAEVEVAPPVVETPAPKATKKAAAKPPEVKPPIAKKAAAKLPESKPPTAKKAAAKPPEPRPPTAKKAAAKLPEAKPPTAKKAAAKLPEAKPPTAKPPTTKKAAQPVKRGGR